MVVARAYVVDVGRPSEATWPTDFADSVGVVKNLLTQLRPSGRELFAAGR